MRILISGMVAGDPFQGGATSAVLQYALGLVELGHDVAIVEPTSPERLRSTRVRGYLSHLVGEAPAVRLALVAGEECLGATRAEVVEWAAAADLLINVSGMLGDEQLLDLIPHRLYLDLDPCFVQLWHVIEGIDMGFDAHTAFATVGLALGDPSCPVPTGGRRWATTLPPVLLSRCAASTGIGRPVFTTVGNWRSYGSIEHGGVHYGQKAHSIRSFLALPEVTGRSFEAALAIHHDEVEDLAMLRSSGWKLVDPGDAAGTPYLYRSFIATSMAEIGFAKTGYVNSRCGWFSDRSALYLAFGRPVCAQDTGFSRFVPTGDGLLAFSTLDEAAAAVEDVHGRWGEHTRAARAFAERHLDSRVVLPRLVEQATS